MPRYTPEQRADALKQVDATNLSKASKELGIAHATLAKWKKERDNGQGQARVNPKQASPQPRKTTRTKKTAPMTDMSWGDAENFAQELLLRDDPATRTIKRLEAENAELRSEVTMLRNSLEALIRRPK